MIVACSMASCGPAFGSAVARSARELWTVHLQQSLRSLATRPNYGSIGRRSRRRGDGSVGLAAQEGRDIENVFLDRVAHRRGAAVRIEALRSRMARIFRNRLCRSPFGVAGRRAERRTL